MTPREHAERMTEHVTRIHRQGDAPLRSTSPGHHEHTSSMLKTISDLRLALAADTIPIVDVGRHLLPSVRDTSRRHTIRVAKHVRLERISLASRQCRPKPEQQRHPGRSNYIHKHKSHFRHA